MLFSTYFHTENRQQSCDNLRGQILVSRIDGDPPPRPPCAFQVLPVHTGTFWMCTRFFFFSVSPHTPCHTTRVCHRWCDHVEEGRESNQRKEGSFHRDNTTMCATHHSTPAHKVNVSNLWRFFRDCGAILHVRYFCHVEAVVRVTRESASDDEGVV